MNNLSQSNQYKRYSKKITPLFKEKRNQAYTMIILSLFAISFFGFLAVRPTLGTIITLQKQIQDRTLVNEKLEEKINALIAAQESYQEIEPDLPLIYTLLPEKPDITSLLLKIEALTQDSNATIAAISFDRTMLLQNSFAQNNVEEIPPLQEDVLAAQSVNETTPLSFTVTFEGTYDELKLILNRLQTLDRIVTIHSAELNLDTIENDTNALILNMQTAAHYFPLSL